MERTYEISVFSADADRIIIEQTIVSLTSEMLGNAVEAGHVLEAIKKQPKADFHSVKPTNETN